MTEEIPCLESLIKTLEQFRKAYAKLCYPHLANYGFSPCEVEILIFLSNNPNIQTAKELTIFLGVSKGLIARSVDNLMKKDLLHVDIDTNDRRIQHLSLSAASSDIIAYLKEKQNEFSQLTTRDIDPDDLLRIGRVFTQMNMNIEGILEGANET